LQPAEFEELGEPCQPDLRSRVHVRREIEDATGDEEDVTMRVKRWRAAIGLTMPAGRLQREPSHTALEHVPEKWTRFSDKDMLPKFLNWREFFSIR
jgi:hypothetical protein